MKRWRSMLPLLFLVGFSVGWRRPYRGRGGNGFNFNFTGGFPVGINAVRTSADNFYTRNGTHAIELSTSASVCEDIGNGLGRGCWAALSNYINDTTGAGKTLTQFSSGDGWNGDQALDRVAACSTGPDGLTPATCLYDIAATYAPVWQKIGVDSTLKAVVGTIWARTTTHPAPSFTNNFNFNYDLGRFQQFAAIPFDLTWAEDFTPDVDGYLTCASFVKFAPDPVTTHRLTLWDVNTTAAILTLDTTGETATGWQVNRVNPGVHLTAGHRYRFSIDYHLGGYYVENVDFVPYPHTQGHLTVNGAFYTETLGNYPNIDNTASNTWFSEDICFEPDTNNDVRADPTTTGAFLTVNSNVAPGAFPASPMEWTRIATGFASDGVNPVIGAMLAYPAGGAVGGNIITFTPTSVGGLQLWGPQVAVGVIEGDPPMVLGQSGNLKMTVTDAARLNTIPDDNGKFNIVADWLVDGSDTSFCQASPCNVLFDFDTPDGKYQLSDGNQTVLSATVRGVDSITSGLSINIGLLQENTVFRTQLYYDPAVPQATIAGWVNGCAASGATVGSISGAVHAPTLASIGSKTDGTLQTQRRVGSWARGDLVGRTDPYRNEFLIMGDSLMSEYPGDHPAVCKYVYTVDESISRAGIFSYAFPGETIGVQLTRYTNSKQFGQPYVLAILQQAGINDISTGSTAAQTITADQTAVTSFNTNNPGAKVYLMPLWPTNATLTGTQQGYWLTFNQAVVGGGGTPITGANLVRMYPGTSLASKYWPFINDGNNNLAAWTSIDGRHQNTAGSKYMGAVTAGYYKANGQLPGGAAPTCTGFSPASGAVGSTVTLTGTGFSSVIGAGVNGTGIGSGIPVSDTSITIVVPPGATTGPVTVANPLGTATCSGGSFTVM